MTKRKYRGRRIDTNEWVTGDLLHIAGGCLIYFGSQEDVDELGPARDDVCVELLNSECAPVYLYSIGESTGLYDSFGEEIWEGDVLQGIMNQYIVIFKDGMFGIEKEGKFESLISVLENGQYWIFF